MKTKKNWSLQDIPSQAGKLAIVTGANSGLGYETALALAQKGATVIMACRSEDKGAKAAKLIEAMAAGAKVEVAVLDLASLASVASFATRITEAHRAVDILINNAGVMSLPTRQVTAEGFERQLGTNYLGHFALTAHLLPLLMAAKARVVQLSSLAHRTGTIDLANFQGERNYGAWKAYGQSKLAMLMFALELQRRSDANGWGLLSTAAHPGFSRTELIANGPGSHGLQAKFSDALGKVLSQSAAAGALPTLFAATAPEAEPGGYYGPAGFLELIGPPGLSKVSRKATDVEMAKRLWEASEALTGLTFTTSR